MKKIILFFIIFLLSVSLVLAEGLVIRIVQHDTTTNIARIQIVNEDTEAYHNISMSIDNGPLTKLVGVIRPKTSIINPVKLTAEKHTVTLTTNEGVFTQNIMGSKTEQDLKTTRPPPQTRRSIPPPPGNKDIKKTTSKKKTEASWSSKYGLMIFLISMAFLILVLAVALKKYKKTTKSHSPLMHFKRPPFPGITPQPRHVPPIQPRRFPLHGKGTLHQPKIHEAKITRKIPEEKIITQKKPEPKHHRVLSELKKFNHPKPKADVFNQLQGVTKKEDIVSEKPKFFKPKADVFKQLQGVTKEDEKEVITDTKTPEPTKPKADIFKKLQGVSKKDVISDLRKIKQKNNQ